MPSSAAPLNRYTPAERTSVRVQRAMNLSAAICGAGDPSYHSKPMSGSLRVRSGGRFGKPTGTPMFSGVFQYSPWYAGASGRSPTWP